MGFGATMTDDDVKISARPLRVARSLAALDGDEIVGTAVVYPMQMNIPEGRSAPAAVVAGVTVLPTHRRRGILTRMMDMHLREAHENDETFAMLGASESIIYGRYGYGIASIIESWSIDRRHTELAYAPESPGRLRFIDKDDAAELLPAVAVRVCADR
ncbi:MAG: GNAT family N-acetyltransferase, partial [Chloroflexi bacterium]|nr:GNAT family N-acetyltransferase [Chloroflexota bacterium]